VSTLRVSTADARRLGALPKAKPKTPTQKALAKAKREKWEDALWAQLVQFAERERGGPVPRGSDFVEFSVFRPIAPGLKSTQRHHLTARRQFQFLDRRAFRADIAIFGVLDKDSLPNQARLLVEVDGGIYVQGGHSRGAGREADLERDALAMLAGWRVLRVSPRHVKDGRAIFWIVDLLEKA
jgi:very-short-patch-repair endonuclease